ncbi:caspase family protein [Salmonella enterica]|nr:caspase family protein [Salmonella enterica]EHM6377905.1 caspase family protein [Salmonella enterica]EHN6182266.1 caspase family protein [Salmonella enterica]EKI5629634.1 caspase family protein [Salmonella enterica]
MKDFRYFLKEKYTNSRALIIGINKYKNVPPLSYAVNDAMEIKDLLINEFNFPEENIAFLINEEASKDNILKSFARLTKDDIELDERIFIFYAGHGETRSGIYGEVGFLVPHDSVIEDLSTFIRWDELTKNSELIRAKHILFIMDACYGGLALTRGIGPGSTRFLNDMMLRYSRQVLTAGKADETVADSGGPLPNHSVFTGHLIEGLKGKAVTENGVLTANGLMTYVYNKVSNDKTSNQTPHYGYIDGDGDFIFTSPSWSVNDAEKTTENDRLISIPYFQEEFSSSKIEDKIRKTKQLLANDSSSIELHDFVINEVKKFLSETSEDFFSVRGQYTKEELLERISKYEQLSKNINLIISCIAYWARPVHISLLSKALARSTDRLERGNGLTLWLNLRWYPLILQLYSLGISAIENRQYDTLLNILFIKLDSSLSNDGKPLYFVEAISNAILELTRQDVFKQLPGFERHYVPMSEHLHTILQPLIDDTLFIGKNYENTFDEFECLFALVVADLKKQQERTAWGPIGRFGWKQQRGYNTPLSNLINEAKTKGGHWEPLKNGFFGGDIVRFSTVADEYLERISNLNWY